MSLIQETPCIWSDSALLDQHPTRIVGQMQNLLLIDDDEIYNNDDDDDDDSSFLPPSSNHDALAVNKKHIQYVNTVRKTRPLPKIPERSSSKGSSTEKNDALKNQNKLTARQLFEMLSDDRITDTDVNDEKEEEGQYGGVYAFKTQLPSSHLSYQYENFNTNYYKMMTPVQEVEEDQLYNYEEDTSYEDNDYTTASTTTTTTDRPLSEISFNAPSLTSGRTSPSSHKSQQSIDSLNHKSDHEHAVYLDGPEVDVNQPAKDESLVSDVKRLAELNQALMTPVISNKNIAVNHSPEPASPVPTPAPASEDYSNINTASPQAMTSFSLTNDKESIKTYRRMATKTHDKNIQFTYAKYLMQLVSFHDTEQESNSTRDRLQEEVEYWIEKLAKANYAEALYIKGQWHRHCCDTSVTNIFVGSQYKKVNHAKAFKCFQQAAKLGSTEAHYELAEYWKDRKDYKKALSSYKVAASKNHILALYKLANIMLRGLMNQEKDAHQGLIFLKKAADSNKPESARSAYDLACIYSNDFESIDLIKTGLITPSVTSQTCSLAIQYYKKADDLGLVLATYRLGYIYEHGHINTVVDLPQAFRYYLKAAEKKHEGAMLEVSKFYKEGIPGFLNPHLTIAHEWFTRAAENGNPVAEFTLGVYFENGIGVYPDLGQALSWYHKAASKGYTPAKDKLSNRSSKQATQNIDIKVDIRRNKKYYEESVRIAEKTRRAHAEQSCQIM